MPMATYLRLHSDRRVREVLAEAAGSWKSQAILGRLKFRMTDDAGGGDRE